MWTSFLLTKVWPPIFEWPVPRLFVHLSSIWTTFSLAKVWPPIFEWAVPRPFVHLRVEIMVLLSMTSDWIFERMILNSYPCTNSLRCSFVSKFNTKLFFFKYMDCFFIDKSRAAHLWVGCAETVCPSSSGNMVLLSMTSDWIFVWLISSA